MVKLLFIPYYTLMANKILLTSCWTRPLQLYTKFTDLYTRYSFIIIFFYVYGSFYFYVSTCLYHCIFISDFFFIGRCGIGKQSRNGALFYAGPRECHRTPNTCGGDQWASAWSWPPRHRACVSPHLFHSRLSLPHLSSLFFCFVFDSTKDMGILHSSANRQGRQEKPSDTSLARSTSPILSVALFILTRDLYILPFLSYPSFSSFLSFFFWFFLI